MLKITSLEQKRIEPKLSSIRFLKIFFLSIFTLCTISLYAQVNVEKLKATWSNPNLHDTVRLNAINDLNWEHYKFAKPDTLFDVAQKQYDFAEKTGNKKWMALALGVQGSFYTMHGNGLKGQEYFTKSLELSNEINFDKGKANAIYNLGMLKMKQGNQTGALENFNESLLLYKKIGYQKGIAGVNMNKGILEYFQGNYSKALEFLEEAEGISDEIKDPSLKMSVLNVLGSLFINQKDKTIALNYFLEGLELAKQIGDKRNSAGIQANIGNVYKQKGENDKAYTYYSTSLKEFEELNEFGGASGCLLNIGTIYFNRGEFTKALESYNKSLAYAQKAGSAREEMMAKLRIEEFYSSQGDNLKAIKIGRSSLKMARESGDIATWSNAAGILYNSYRMLGQLDSALKMQDVALTLLDSLNSIENKEVLIEQGLKFVYEQKALTDSLNQVQADLEKKLVYEQSIKQKDKQRNMFVSASLIMLILAGGLWGRLRYTRKAKAIIEKEKDRSESLLLNILPADVAEELKENGKTEARDFDMVSIIFTDFIDFTAASAKLSAKDLVEDINACFGAFDKIMEKYGIEKIKTIGDAYMAAGGMNNSNVNFADKTIRAALEMQAFIKNHQSEMDKLGRHSFEMRIGIHTGPVVAGIVGVKKFQYDIWGDTVNTASRIESNGEAGKVNISQATYELLKDDPQFVFESRGKIEAKGKGTLYMYFVSIKS